jgi:predicted nuclease of restriction endonuclease-like RecB superfamily
MGISAERLQRHLYDDRKGARRLRSVPTVNGRALLARYNLELARGVLRDATRMEIHARGGWRDIFSAVKLAGLMHEIHRTGRRYHLVVTGPAAQYLVRPARYGVRFARLLPVLARSPGWRIDAELVRNDEPCTFRIAGRARALADIAPVGGEPRRERYDSAWERRFVRDLRASHWVKEDGWKVTRERTPLSAGQSVFLPDFTLRNVDGRMAAVELVGFWTPDYLQRKAEKVRAAAGVPLVLVVAKELAVGGATDALVDAAQDRIVWCGKHPRVSEVMRVVERVAIV